jgi:hypothetical protein
MQIGVLEIVSEAIGYYESNIASQVSRVVAVMTSENGVVVIVVVVAVMMMMIAVPLTLIKI